jgi:hypothetical protein
MPSCRNVWQKPQNFWTTSLMGSDLSEAWRERSEMQRERIVADSAAILKRRARFDRKWLERPSGRFVRVIGCRVKSENHV